VREKKKKILPPNSGRYNRGLRKPQQGTERGGTSAQGRRTYPGSSAWFSDRVEPPGSSGGAIQFCGRRCDAMAAEEEEAPDAPGPHASEKRTRQRDWAARSGSWAEGAESWAKVARISPGGLFSFSFLLISSFFIPISILPKFEFQSPVYMKHPK
jgi:hypothetical protein